LKEKKQRKSYKKNIEEIENLKKTLNGEREKSKQYLNRLKYLQADFENYSKRAEKEMNYLQADFENYSKRAEKEMNKKIEISKERIIMNLLNIMDDLEKAIEVGKKTENVKALREGVEIVYGNLVALLEKEGLEKVDSVGLKFDPNLHEILEILPSKENGEDVVVEEKRKGFKFRGKIIRPSIVNIAKSKGEL
jgi:molecular chaperone GrpE